MRWTRVPIALVTVVGSLQIVTPIRGAVPEATASAEVTEGEAGTAPSTDYLEKYSRPFRIDTRELGFTEKYYWRRLSHPTADDRRLGGAVLAVAFALWSHKNQIQIDMAQRDTPVEHQATLKTIEKLGGGAVVPATALLMYVGGSAFRGYRAKQTGVMLAHSLLLTDLVTLAGRRGVSTGFWAGPVVADPHGLSPAQPPSRLRPSPVGPIPNARGAPAIGARGDFGAQTAPRTPPPPPPRSPTIGATPEGLRRERG